MYEVKVRGTVVGTSTGTAKATGNPYTMVTLLVGGEPMTLMLSKQAGVPPVVDAENLRETNVILGLSAYRTEARLDFLRTEDGKGS